MVRKWTWLATIAVVATLAVAGKLYVASSSKVDVTIVRVTRGTVEETVTNTRAGTIKARHRASLSSETGGRVAQIPRREGVRVRREDLLLLLNDEIQRAQVELAEKTREMAAARRDEACLAARLAEREYQRGQALLDDGITTEQGLDTLMTRRDQARAACTAASAAVEQAEAELTLRKALLEQTRLRAPFDGVVAEVSTEVGEWITPSPPGVPIPPVIDLIDTASLYVSAPIDEIDSGRVEEGQKVRVTVDSHPDVAFDGVVTRVSPYVLDRLQQNRTVEVEVGLMDLGDATLLPGTSADVEIILRSKADVLRIPASALGEGDKVLAVENDRLVEVAVQTGLNNWKYVEIVDGVDAGDPIVVSRESTDVRPGAVVGSMEER